MNRWISLFLGVILILSLGACGGSKQDYSADLSAVTELRFDMTREDVSRVETGTYGNRLSSSGTNSNGDLIDYYAEKHHVYVFDSETGKLLFFTYTSDKKQSDSQQDELLKSLKAYPSSGEKSKNAVNTCWYGMIGSGKCRILDYKETTLDNYHSTSVASGEYDTKTGKWKYFS